MELIATPHRIEWIDWMKAIGIYFIVLGHFFSLGDKFVYVFNVPLFFIVSGFLCKKESDMRVFWNKLWFNLLIPMLVISTANYLCEVLRNGTIDFCSIAHFVISLILGFHAGVKTCWFVYTLILLKIIYQYCPKRALFVVGISSLLMAYIYNHFDFSNYSGYLKASNSVVNVCTAFPFFALGIWLRSKKNFINSLDGKIPLIVIFIVCLLFVYVCGKYNGYVWMYKCGYGGNFLWFLLGGTAGSYCIFALSKLLGHTPRFITTISKGTILILGFHSLLIPLFRHSFNPSIADFIFAAIIITVFVPVIMLAEKYFPLVLGKYRITKG